MGIEILATYLDDHLAGSVAAIQLVDHLRDLTRGTEREQLFTTLRSEIEEDQKVVKSLLRALGRKESRTRKAAAWLTEKVGEAKLKLDDPSGGELRLLEAFEILELGILGKLGLWRVLGVAADLVPEVGKLDLKALEQRATSQHDRVEVERLRVARAAFGT